MKQCICSEVTRVTIEKHEDGTFYVLLDGKTETGAPTVEKALQEAKLLLTSRKEQA